MTCHLTYNTLYNTEVSNLSDANNEYIWTVEVNGCLSSDTVEVLLQELPTVSFSATPTTQTYPNSTINIENLSNQGYEFYKWDFGDGNTRLDNSRVENKALPDELKITSLSGQKVYHKTKLNSIEAINLSKNGSGIYIISIKQGNEVIRAKVVVNR